MADINLTPGAHAKTLQTADHPKTGETVVLRTHVGDIPQTLWVERTERFKQAHLPSMAAIRFRQSTPNGYVVGYNYIPGALLTEAPLTPAEADEAIKTIASTVASLHAVGAIHGNIHPAQFRVGQDGKTPILLDAGWFWSDTSENYGTGADISGIKQTASVLPLSPKVAQAVASFAGASARELVGVIGEAIKASEVSIDDDMFAGFGAPAGRPAPVSSPAPVPAPVQHSESRGEEQPREVESAPAQQIEAEEEVIVAAPNPTFRPKAFNIPSPVTEPAPVAQVEPVTESVEKPVVQAQPETQKEVGERGAESVEPESRPNPVDSAAVTEPVEEQPLSAEPAPAPSQHSEAEPVTETPVTPAPVSTEPVRNPEPAQQIRSAPAPAVATESAPIHQAPTTEPTPAYTPAPAEPEYEYVPDQEQTVEHTSLGEMFENNDEATALDEEPHHHEKVKDESPHPKRGMFGAVLPSRKSEKTRPEPAPVVEHEADNGSVATGGKNINRRALLIGGGTLAALALGTLGVNALKGDNENTDQANASETPATTDKTMAIPAGYQSTGSWTISVPEGAQVVANNAAVVLLADKVMSLYSVTDGKKIRDIKLTSNSATVDETSVADTPGLIIRDGETRLLYWDTGKGAKGELVDEKIGAESKIKNSGTAPYIVEKKTMRGITTKGLTDYKIPDNNTPITFDGKTLYSGVVGVPVTLSKASGDIEKVINLAAPKDALQMNQWVAVGNGTALTAWSEKGTETDDATPVTVALNSLTDGKLTDSYESTLGQIKNSKWVKGQGGRYAGLGNAVINLEKGKVTRRLPEGMNVTAIKGDLVTGTDSSANSYIFQGDNPGYVLTSTLRAQTGAGAIVQQGSSLVMYPSTLS